MTFLHFANCLLFAFGPTIMTYQSSKLKAFRSYGFCASSAFYFVFLQLAKLMALATLQVSVDDAEGGAGSLFAGDPPALRRFAVAVGVHFLDFIVMNIVLNQKRALSPQLRALGIGVGWAFGEAASHYAVPLWRGARGAEFSWEFLQMGAQANIHLVVYSAYAAFTLLWKETGSGYHVLGGVGVLLYSLLQPLLDEYQLAWNVSAPERLASEAVIAATLAFLAWRGLAGATRSHKKA